MSTNPEEPYSAIHKSVQIRILQKSEDFIVIDKPCNLRSVPGNAKSQPTENVRRTAQEAWVMAVQSFARVSTQVQTEESQRNKGGIEEVAILCLQNIANMNSNLLESIPRKLKLFQRYFERNHKRLLPLGSSASTSVPQSELQDLATTMFRLIEARQRPLLNLPVATRKSESAFGQLLLLDQVESEKLIGTAVCNNSGYKVVHRLDCETSGVMIFARNELSASQLAKAWRERRDVHKYYFALVKNWPPYHKKGQKEGSIDLALEPCQHEKLKWQVAKCGGKESSTRWRVLKEINDPFSSVVLELEPITGRTHQLRIHCASVGSGIVGDSLYGDEPVRKPELSNPKAPFLHLHAWKLSFPHPRTGETCEFTSFPPWYPETP